MGSAYRESRQVLASSRDDAITAAARAARRYLILPSEFRRSVESVEPVDEQYARAHHVILQREVVHRFEPGLGTRPRDVQPLPRAAAVDPWGVDPASLRRESRVVTTCLACAGTKKVSCRECSGSGRLRCGYCGGSGLVRGQRGVRNCQNCSGRGDRKCSNCANGRVDCLDCGVTGRVYASLEIVESRRDQVRVHPRNAAASAHVRVDDVADFDAGPNSWVNELEDDNTFDRPDDNLHA